MWFQRVEEIEEPEEQFVVGQSQGTSARINEPGDRLPRRSTGPILRPGDFQRVRLLRKLARLRNSHRSDHDTGTLELPVGDSDMNDEEYRRRLEQDLRKSGMDEKLISTVLKKDKDVDPERPTYTRMSLKHISVEVLNRHGIGFGYDQVRSCYIVFSTS